MYRYIVYFICYSYIYIYIYISTNKKKVRLDLPWFTPSNLWDLLLKDRNFHRLTIYFHRLIQQKRNAGEMPWIFSDEGMASLKSFKTDLVWFGSPCYSDSHSLLIAKKTCHPLVYCGNKKTLQAQMRMNCCLHVQQLTLQWGGLFTEIPRRFLDVTSCIFHGCQDAQLFCTGHRWSQFPAAAPNGTCKRSDSSQGHLPRRCWKLWPSSPFAKRMSMWLYPQAQERYHHHHHHHHQP